MMLKVNLRSFSDLYVSACVRVCVQCWTWRGMCLCTGPSWSCWEPSPPAPRWFLCCCLSLVTWDTGRKRKTMKSPLRDTRLSECCWPRWKHALTRTPTASGWLPLVNTDPWYFYIAGVLASLLCVYTCSRRVCAQRVMRDHIYCWSDIIQTILRLSGGSRYT